MKKCEAAPAGSSTLAGHSYGGMAITGAADRAPQRVRRLVYVDAYVPQDGASCWTLTNDTFRQAFVAGAGDPDMLVDILLS